MAGDRIRFAVIGCGHIGKRHLQVLSGGGPFELVAACDTDPGARPASGIPFFGSIGELVASGIAFDAATIATPNGLHEEHAIALLRSGRHVLIEKPMALSAASCRRIIEEARRQGKQAFCVLQLKHSPVAQWLKQLVAEGRLGRLFLAQVNCFWNRDERYYKKGSWHGTKAMDGGMLYTQFSHYIDLLYWLFGDVQNISSRLSVYRHGRLADFEDTGLVNFGFTGGGMGSLSLSTAVLDSNLESNLTLIGENGTIKISGQYLNNVEHCHLAAPGAADWPRTQPTPAGNHRFFFEDVVRVLHANGKAKGNAEEAMKVVEIIERIYASNIQ